MLCAIQSHYDVSVLVQENSFSRFTACVLYIVLLTVYVLEIASVEVCVAC